MIPLAPRRDLARQAEVAKPMIAEAGKVRVQVLACAPERQALDQSGQDAGASEPSPGADVDG